MSIEGDLGEAKAFLASKDKEQSGKTNLHIIKTPGKFYSLPLDDDSGDSDGEEGGGRRVRRGSVSSVRTDLPRLVSFCRRSVARGQRAIERRKTCPRPIH